MRISDWSSDVCSSDLSFKTSRNSAIRADDHHRLANFIDRAAVVHRAAEVGLQLWNTSHAGKQRCHEEAAELWLQRSIGPRPVEAHLIRHLAKGDRKSTRLNSSH